MKRTGRQHIPNMNKGDNIINSYLGFFIFHFSMTTLLQLGVYIYFCLSFFWWGGGGVKWINVIYIYMCFPLFFRLQFRRGKHRCYKHKQLKIIVVNKVDYICFYGSLK